jgi:PAS domain S-box-containing protein
VVGRFTPEIWHDPEEIRVRAEMLTRELGVAVEGIRAFLETPERQGFETRDWTCCRKDGSRVPMALTVSGLRNAAGEITGYMGMAVNISERKNLESTVATQAEKLNAIIQAVDAGVWEWDIKQDTTQYNLRFKQMLGYEDHELPNRSDTWKTLIAPKDLPGVEENLRKHLLSRGRLPFSQVVRYRHKNGSIVHVLCSGKVIEWNDRGEPQRMVGSHVDITPQVESELMARRLQEMFQKTGEVAQVGSWEVDLIHGKSWWSDVTREIHEVSPEFVPNLERGINFFLTNQEREVIAKAYHRAVEEGIPYDLELRIRTARNRVRWIRTVAFPERKDGRTVRLIGAFQDITKEVRLRENLAAERDFSRVLIENLEAGISLVNANGEQFEVNPSFCAMTGYSREELIGKTPPYPYWHRDHLEEIYSAFHKVLAGDFSRLELPFQHKNGSTIYVEIAPSLIGEVKENGKIYVATTVDITERKRTEKALRQQEEVIRRRSEELENFFNNSLDLLCIADKEGRFVRLNSEWEKLLGYPLDELIGRKYLELVHPDDVAATAQTMQNLAQGEPIDFFENRYLHKNGQWLWIEWKSISVGEKVYAAARDVTQRRQSEEQLRELNHRLQAAAENAKQLSRKAEAANQAKSAFLAAMSHEIRTPLNGVLGAVQMLTHSPLNPEQTKFCEIAASSGELLLATISDILDFSKIEAGEMKAECAAFHLPAEVGKVIGALQAEASRKGLDLTVAWQGEPPDEVLGDRTLLRQVLLNLLGNAIKFTEKGSVSLRIEAASETPDERMLFLVQDTGIGIPADKLETIFDPFAQAEIGVSRRYGGTGLGLSISSRLVTMMGGKLEVQSEPGHGAVFRFSIPLPAAVKTLAPAQEKEKPPLLVPTTPEAHARKILLVEDNETNAIVCLSFLAQLGFANITRCHNGAEAVRATETGEFDIILMDCQMPVMDGYEATRQIRQRELNGRPRVRILGLSAGATGEERTQGLAAGMDGYLTKPIRRDDLQDAPME